MYGRFDVHLARADLMNEWWRAILQPSATTRRRKTDTLLRASLETLPAPPGATED